MGGGKTFADDSLTGLHLGFGLNVVADEYKSDVDVLGIAKYASGGERWTFTGKEFFGDTVDDITLEYKGQDGYGLADQYDGGKDEFTFQVTSPYATMGQNVIYLDVSSMNNLLFSYTLQYDDDSQHYKYNICAISMNQNSATIQTLTIPPKSRESWIKFIELY